MLMLNKNIVQLVDENFIYARALHYLGIRFMDFTDKTLIEVCRQRSININIVLKTLDSFIKNVETEQTDLNAFPIGLIVGYLKHSHHTFIKDRLPYIHSLIDSLTIDTLQNSDLKDLHLIFPVFLEDFIKHIYEEEDTLFGYIQSLEKFDIHDQKSISEVIIGSYKHSLKEISKEHSEEDEMEGLREMISCIMDQTNDDVVVKTIVKELLAFDEELDNHAHIENDILFPKVIALEEKVLSQLKDLSTQN